MSGATGSDTRSGRLSDQLERWLEADDDHTVGGLVETFEEKGFALLLIVLLGPSALPLPTGGVTNVLEVIAALVALQLIAGRECVWLPRRWRQIELAGPQRQRALARLLAVIRALERVSRPRLTFLFGHRAGNTAFGALVLVFVAGAFAAPPFSGLDTLPSIGVVLLAVGVLLEDALIAATGVVAGVAGIVLEVVLGKAALSAAGELL